MSKTSATLKLEPARFPTNCGGCGAPIVRGEPTQRQPRIGALTCATCARGHLRPRAPGSDQPPTAA